MPSEQAVIRNYSKTSITMDELAVPNRSGNTTSPNNYLRDADDKEYGYAKPVIFINGYFVQKFLMDFDLDFNSILPTVSFKFYTGNPTFIGVSYPKDGDVISIYIRSNVSVYKPIRMDFTVLSVDSNRSTDSEGTAIIFSILGECRIPGFYTEVCKAFRNKTSSQALFEVSQDLDLGFASNDFNMNDKMTWINPNLSYYNFIKDVTISSYKDDQSFYATWIDAYYNLNFVNINNQLTADDIVQNVLIVPGSATGKADDTLFPGIELKPAEVPLMVTNAPQFFGYPFYANKFTMLSEAGNTTNKMGYIQVVQFYNDSTEYKVKPSEKSVNYTIQATTTDAIRENMVLQRGRASEKEYLKEIRKKWMGILDTGDTGSVHKNYLQARVQNPLNLSDVTKFTLQVETQSYFGGFYRGQVVPVMLYSKEMGTKMQNTGISNDQKAQQSAGLVMDQFLSGQYVLMGYSISWNEEKGFYQVLNLCKREWILNSAGKQPKAFPINIVSNSTAAKVANSIAGALRR
jgi:hypothetical protein